MKVDENESKTLKVISATLLNSEMCVHSGISSRSCQVLTIAVWNMLSRLWISKSLGETKVNDVNKVLLLLNSYQEVIRLDISMKKVARMNEFKSLEL